MYPVAPVTKIDAVISDEAGVNGGGSGPVSSGRFEGASQQANFPLACFAVTSPYRTT